MINFIIYDDDPKIRHLYLKIIHKYMGIKNAITRVGAKAGDSVAKLAVLSPEQLQEVEDSRDFYLSQKPDPTDTAA